MQSVFPPETGGRVWGVFFVVLVLLFVSFPLDMATTCICIWECRKMYAFNLVILLMVEHSLGTGHKPQQNVEFI